MLALDLKALQQRLATAKLIYSAITSLDGYVADVNGNFDWPRLTRSCTPSSTTSSDRLAPTSTGAACTR